MHAGFTTGCGFISSVGRRWRACQEIGQPIEENHMKRLFALLLLAMFSMSTLTACNTMAGAGKDVQKVGEKVEDKAQDCKDGKC
jgi:predicted small secreted protein